ncbi:hypothetical protein PRUPE_3G044200 [Prunus persica]|uniref:Midasin n=1 Tax=Prunus persica TaxID=3760 RepID=A0A251PV68_PRUPE|nr:midasin isoform X3 [Prunus persica]ONI15461.1 hypothetical protein PRUPE_3G044200 [Prunus persica]
MAMDGSFSLESALERFLARCPKLQSSPKFVLLTKKGNALTQDEVVKALVELFVHPNYTIPLMGCFRPIAQKIVDKAVKLLRLVPNLRSNSDRGVVEVGKDRDLNEVENVIEFYSGTGRGLDLHELVCLAFCRALELAPFFWGSIVGYFEFAPPPFERILMGPKVSNLGVEIGTRVLLVVGVSYRLLLVKYDFFSKLQNWSCFLDLVEQSANFDMHNSTSDTVEVIADIRWCGLQIISLILKLSCKATENLGITDEDAFSCLLRWEEFCQDVSFESGGWYVESSRLKGLVSLDGRNVYCQKSCLQSSSQCYDMEPQTKRQRDERSAGDPFVVTSAVKESFKMMLSAVKEKWPVLLYGPTGCGKSALISKLSQDSGNQVLSIHMDDQIDGRTLIGSYVCTEKPGEFKWQPGSLTQAVSNGYWVVFEDIDKAPSDVRSVILPLLEGVNLFATGHGQEIRVPESFRIFSTISTSKLDPSCIAEGGNSLSIFFKVYVSPSTNEDLQSIVKAWYPSLEPLAVKLTETFESINSATLHQTGGFQAGNSASVSYPSRFSLRDLLKWCKRITGLGFSFEGDDLSPYARDCIYQEAVDIFAAFSTSTKNRLTLMQYIARLWDVPSTVSDTLYPPNKPVVQDLLSDLRVGRVSLPRTHTTKRGKKHYKKKPFVEIRSSIHLLERIASSVKWNEPVLLVGETGTGKTTLVQDLAMRLGHKLTVLNLSQQSDVADLLGGYKPMDAKFIYLPLYNEFCDLFSKSFHVQLNPKFIGKLEDALKKEDWERLLKGFEVGVKKFFQKVEEARSLVEESGKKRKKAPVEEQIKAWENFTLKVENASAHGMIFSFVEGAFVTALRNGEWILLDEVNLAPPETLQRVISVLEGEHGSLCLAERGDIHYIDRHPSFRLFACMNPATDAGKRDLPFSLRSRFTEYFVDDVLDAEDLTLFVGQFLGDRKSDLQLVYNIVSFYKIAKKLSEEKLQDGANQKPQYSLRSLYRALEYTTKAERELEFGFPKAIYDGFCMFFLTLLDKSSALVMEETILKYLLGGKVPKEVPYFKYLSDSTINGSSDNIIKYTVTESVEERLRNLARAIWIKKYPVLLQGPTSSGKTSLVQHLAAITGHEFVRINNHEHTDLQEYLGSYITDASGKLVFHEGVLVKAVRNGYWIVLDELNLAPSDVLEALNRLLDDNRELFVPELQETIHADENFMLFATQNPPGFYGGRKMLSRAFRNRFVEIHVDEIPETELSTILLERRPGISKKMAKQMITVMKELQLKRQMSKVFAGKHGFITPRDLFRWADRFIELGGGSDVDLARDGYYLLAERLRDEGEKCVVREVLEKNFHVKLDEDNLYFQEPVPNLPDGAEVPKSLQNWTKSMRRLYFLVERCYKVREPVLLVGETGVGKTTVCQLLSILLGSKLHILNCHQYTETSDFLGGFYPIRERSRLTSDFKRTIEELLMTEAFNQFHLDYTVSSDIGQASTTLCNLNKMIKDYKQGQILNPDVTKHNLMTLEGIMLKLSEMHQEWQKMFVWLDGPLVQAMRSGDLFLVDEISLADDSVLERLNSVLEPERTLSLAEKGGPDLEKVVAHERFFLLATMNPGGDFGKKELSPALRNRFTEIWVPTIGDRGELESIGLARMTSPKLSSILDPLLNFWEQFNNLKPGRTLTVRDLLSWIDFINVTENNLGSESAFLHGAFLVLLDGLSLGSEISKGNVIDLRNECFKILLKQLKGNVTELEYSKLARIQNYGWGDPDTTEGDSCSDSMQCDNIFGVDPFYIEKGSVSFDAEGFEILAPTTRRNVLRVLRAMQLPKPVLLEGSPGVGKTSLIVALGKFSGHNVVRINLSEQTDMMDLLGSDLPVESDEGMKFAWSDGIFLQALKEGSWVLLDELNLAPQSVLEGLNAILDHRAEVFIPELGYTFKCPSSFRIFACQNPSYQGGGRKGLPKSFLNRFTKVYVDELVEDDYHFICSSLFPSIPIPLLSKLILFNKRLYEDTMVYHKFALEGSPWEFNLRDVIRSCQIIQDAPSESKDYCFLDIVYVQRMRTESDRRKVLQLYEQVFEIKPYINPYPRVHLNSEYLMVGNTAVRRNCVQSSRLPCSTLKILPGIRQSLEATTQCVEHQWMCILIGPASCGKTSLVRLLAQLTGNVLNELHLSSGTDISEILGCFEQYNAFRNFRSVVAEVDSYVKECCSLRLEFSKEAFLHDSKVLITRWFSFVSNVNCDSISCFSSNFLEDRVRFSNSLTLLMEIVEHLKLVVEKNVPSISWSSKELDSVMRTIIKLQEGYEKGPFSVKFEWVTGVLIKAVERGEWIVLENANCCNPTVLDRINSLVEPSGSITINERGVVDGKPVVIQPHPDFRMFLTVNPSYGEVSRAMRNRGVEIFMMQPNWLLDESSRYTCEETELNDVKRFLVLSGVPFAKLVHSMAKSHIYARGEGLRFGVSITYLELARWVQLFKQFLMNGSQPLWSLQTSWKHIYLSTFGEAVGGNVISHVKCTYLSGTELCESDSSLRPSLCLPGGWPTPLKLRELVWHSKQALVKTNCMYLEFLGAKYASYKFQHARSRCNMSLDSTACRYVVTYLRGMGVLNETMVHRASTFLTLISIENTEVDKVLAKVEKKLLFAAKWAIEQATESDLKLYLLWFSWFHSRLQPFCQFFDSFVKSVALSMDHPVWEYTSIRCHDLASLHKVEFEKQLIPLLSLGLVDVIESNEKFKISSEFLHSAVKYVKQLRLTYQEWNNEDSYASKEACYFEEVLKCLRKESNNLDSSSRFHSGKSLLWVHGGHPILPSSSKLFEKQLQILELCESVWPTRTGLFVHVNDPLIGVVSDLRSFVLEGVSMSSCITGKSDSCEDEDHVVQQLDRIYQKLLQLFVKERIKIEETSWSNKIFCGANGSFCCSLCIVALGQAYGYGCWQDVFPLMDSTSFALDMKLLQELSSVILVNNKRLRLDLAKVSSHMKYALKFSLSNSSRPPQMFSPHQKILWILDVWSSVDAVNEKVSSFVLEMWFRWHQSLWMYCPVSVKSFSSTAVYDIPVPDVLIQPVVTATVFQILQSTPAIKDYFVSSLKLRVASSNLWRGSLPGANLPFFLLSAARSLFQQIIYAHEKSFDADQFAKIKSVLEQGSGLVVSHISKSSHHGLKDSVDLFIKPLLQNLYPHCSSKEPGFNHGCAWLRLGILRLKLLLCGDDMDPAMKYHCKNSLLAEKISLLKLEIQVRQKCEYLAGQISTRYSHEKRAQALNKLEAEHKRLQRKIVFRSDYRKFKGLKHECDEFLERVTSDEFFQHVASDTFYKYITCSEILVGSVDAVNLQQILDQGSNWQKMATGFIEQLLSDEYREYTDIVQPVLVALYEIKLGLGLILASIVQKMILTKVELDNANMIMGSICSFMRFPRVSASKSISVNLNTGSSKFPYNLEIPTIFNAEDISLLEKLITFSSGVLSNKMVSVTQLKTTLHRNILVRVSHSVANARLMDYASFMLLDKTYSEITDHWMSMKIQSRNKQDYASLQFKFKPRAFKLESIIDLDISALGKTLANQSFLDWKEFISVDQHIEREEAPEEQEDLDGELKFMEDSIVKDVVKTHNQLFGSNNLVLAPGAFHVNDLDRILSFTDSHTIGVGMVRGLGGSFLSSLDAILVPENLFRICVEHEWKFVSSDTSARKYNIYKDPNAPKMYEMVNLLTALKQQIHSLLNEYEEHHELQRILDSVEMLLNIPMSTSLAKALSGLQFLINKLRLLQENGSRFAFSDQVKPICDLVLLWQRMELESWPALLDEVQDRYEINAEKLWFSLYSVLRHRLSSDVVEYKNSTTESLEEFIHSSSIGEFRKRLQLLFAFLGQINTGISLQVYSSGCEKKNVKILYNAFGYYAQFLPAILAHMDSSRRDIEMELKRVLKLCQWDHRESAIENFTSTRQKLRKIIKKYTVVLEQPVIVFLGQHIVKGAESQPQQGQKFFVDDVNRKIGTMDAPFDLTVFNDEDRCMWYTGWIKEADAALKKLRRDRTLEFGYSESKGANSLCSDVAGILRQCSASLSAYPLYTDEWHAVWHTLQNIFDGAVDCCDLWKDASKSQKKGRAFSYLLNLLKSSGLSRDIFTEDEVKSWWFVHPSYDVQHLLLTQSRLPYGDSDAALPLPHQDLVTEWKTTNEYYFSSIASVLFTHKQIGKPDPFLHQLIKIQKNQHKAANKFAEQLRDLKECISTLENLDSTDSEDKSGNCSIGQKQHATFKYMWQQKQLFDSLCATSHEELLLLKTFDNTHLKGCQTVKNEGNEFLASIEKFIPVLQKSKESLDNYLLGPDRAIVTLAGSSQRVLISKDMEQLVSQNFEVLKEFEEHLLAFHAKDVDKSSVEDILLGHFVDILEKGRSMEVEFNSVMDEKNVSVGELENAFWEALRSTFEHIVGAMQKLGSPSNDHVHPDKLGQITSWEKVFDSFLKNLSLDDLRDKLLRTIFNAGELVNHCGGNCLSLLLRIEAHFKHLCRCLDILLNFGHALMKELLAMCKTVSLIIHKLANVLALYSKGSGISSEDKEDDATGDISQDKKGTGMGEGVGLNDVSDQITDEDQLLGISEKASEEQDASGEVPSKNDKGIEMEEDFAADTFSVSEDSEDDANEDDADEHLESAMGETGVDGETVDEKLWNKDEDENLNNSNEKYESGNSVNDRDASSRELRAKDDSAAATNEPGELDLNEIDEDNGEIGSQDDLNDVESVEDMNLDKQEAVVDPTGLNPDDLNQNSDETMELDDPEMHDEHAKNEDHEEEQAFSTDETMGEAETEQIDATPERDDASKDHEDNPEINSGLSKDVFELGESDSMRDDVPNTEPSTQPKSDLKASDPRDVAPESNWANSNDIHNELTPMRGLPSTNTSELDMMISEASDNGKNVAEQPKSQLPRQESSSERKTKPNPYRSVGDALKEWEERVRVSVDLQEGDVEPQDEIKNENADEFGYVSEYEKGTAQALGPATSEQIDRNVDDNKSNAGEDDRTTHKDGLADMEIENKKYEAQPSRSRASMLQDKIEDQMHLSGIEKLPGDEYQDIHSRHDVDPESIVEDVVSVKTSYFSDDMHQLSKLSVNDSDMGKAQVAGEFSDDVVGNATVLWRRYEQTTTRLSQELAEQLRLVMEPNRASKLEGDYKTGKRINMKKVIPYMASHYRKDKIWLRRTRPNKRDYQVVIAVDDSRSMSESCCGDVAIEALVTVCRAMSQLEMGNLAVASFGKKGNIRLLHDFDQPFTGEAGIKMISSLSFKQENTIADEPVVDLLKYLNKKLDEAVARARLPSGWNPLEQLVLIIADGRFHEKENLKQCVRDALARKRMVAFLLLDNPQESIMDLMEASFEGGNIKFSKYMDSFPFPFYIVLRNIEALPRTLADLLRQWFEQACKNTGVA